MWDPRGTVRRKARRSVILAAILAASWVLPATAVTPTIGVDHYPQDTVETFNWGTGATSAGTLWLRQAFEPSAEDQFQAGFNNSRAPDFLLASGSPNLIKYQARQASDCADVPVAWYACTKYDPPPNGNGQLDQIIFATETAWCQNPAVNGATGCRSLQRVAIHELGHAAGLARAADNGGNDAHATESESWTVLRAGVPAKAVFGWDTLVLQECDVIELQREYDVESYAGTYANCVDELAGLTGGLLTSVTVHNPPSTTLACPGDVVTLSGNLRLATVADWGLFSNNPLGRNVTIQRRQVFNTNPETFSAWALLVATTTNTSGNWSRTTAMTSGTFEYRMVYAGEVPVHAVTSLARRVTWSSPC